MSTFDYYEVLGISQTASAEDIKKAYRKLALETHPDRNPGDARAEERFKRINEAYGVLSDPQKRTQYDQYRRVGHQSQAGRRQAPGFGYSQEEIFRDFFTSGHGRDVFSDMQREFERMGMRFDPTFINNLFFGGKDVFFQGFIFGPGKVRVVRYGTPRHHQRTARMETGSAVESPKPGKFVSLLAKAGRKAGEFLLKKTLGLDTPSHSRRRGEIADGPKERDLTYRLAISRSQANAGAVVLVSLPHLDHGKQVSVRIPAGVRSGTKLRLREMGNTLRGDPNHRGDVYLELRVG